jgi:high-affinity iron transporter
MFTTSLIIYREIVEIAMIVGVILAATRGLQHRMRWIAGGFVTGIAGALLVAIFAQGISTALSGMGQEFFNALVLFTAAIVIGWTAIWLRRNARLLTTHLRNVGQQVSTGHAPLYTLAIIIGLSLLREGSEIVLFIYGMALSGESAQSIIAGCAVGLALGLLTGILLYYGLLKIPARHMLRVTSWLLILLVAGLASQGTGFLTAAGYFNDWSQPVWDSSWLLSEESIPGRALHTLVGYSSHPTPVQLAVYTGTLLLLCTLIARINGQNKVQNS